MPGISGTAPWPSPPRTPMSEIYRDSIFWVEVDRIKPNPFQPRREFDQARLEELADSIKMYGLLQPLTVTRAEYPQADGGLRVEYELIAGERRLRASKLAGLIQVPVIIRTGEDSDQTKLELAIIENLQREDLNAIDRAKAFERLVKEFGFKQIDVGKRIGRSREYVANTLRLLTLPNHIQDFIAQGKVSEGHTRPVLMLNDRPEEQDVLVKEIMLKKLTVREAEAIARRVAQDRVTGKHKIDPEILALEKELSDRLGTRVHIEPRPVGGRLVISFFSSKDLAALLESIRVESPHVAAPVFDGWPEGVPMQSGEPDRATVVAGAVASVLAAGAAASVLGERDGEHVSEAASAGVEEAGTAPVVAPTQSDTAGPLSGTPLTPDPVRPMPEPAHVPPQPAQAPAVDPVPGDEPESIDLLDDRAKDEREYTDDLYDIRNFTI